MPTNTQNILTAASGIFTSILGIATGNPVAAQSGITAVYSILSPTQRSVIQYGSNQALIANSNYNAALGTLQQKSSPIGGILVIGAVGFILYKLLKRKR